MMVSFRPHTMRIVRKDDGHKAANGDWIEGVESYSDPIPCRYEPNGRANTIALPDGNAYRYSFTVYLNVDPALVVPYGSLIELTSQDGRVIGTYEVKGFHRGQLDMKIWV